ncbi:MAG: hypothetical protein QM820_20275 [Minicystis sp.]
MNQRLNFLTAVVLAAGALTASVTGCELIASVDRSKISGTGGTGTGGAGGAGGGTGGMTTSLDRRYRRHRRHDDVLRRREVVHDDRRVRRPGQRVRDRHL